MRIDPDARDSVTFMLSRAIAIQNYATLEMSLCWLFGNLVGTTGDISAVIFFKITNTPARMAILDKLLTIWHSHRKCCGCSNRDQPCIYKKSPSLSKAGFWGWFDKLVKAIDAERNKVVHWHQTTATDNPKEFVLKSMSGFHDGNAPEYTSDQLNEFSHKCRFASEMCMMFRYVLGPIRPADWSDEAQATWRGIFQQPDFIPLRKIIRYGSKNTKASCHRKDKIDWRCPVSSMKTNRPDRSAVGTAGPGEDRLCGAYFALPNRRNKRDAAR
jgi:hypothetical protein